jgi:hypothetical protein
MVLRRAGEVCQAKDLVDMAEIGALFGDRLDSLPPRARTPAEQTADEAMIEKGV